MVTGDDDLNTMIIPTYRSFGFRGEWLRIFFEETRDVALSGRLGKDMIPAFREWGRHGGLLERNNEALPIVDKLATLGAGSLKVWGYIFVNLAYNSNLIKVYVRNFNFNEAHGDGFLMAIFGNRYTDTSKRSFLTALKNTLKSSPIGVGLNQGHCEMKGKSVVSITRRAWQNPEPLVILYSLYRFAKCANDLHSFTLTELVADGEREAMSPRIIFGLEAEELRVILQGLANDYSDFIRVDFNKGVLDNIFLNAGKTLDDVVEIF